MKIKRGIIAILIMVCLNAALALFAMKTGSIEVSFSELLRGLFVEFDENVSVIYNLRFPRIIVALIAGGALSVSGLLLQSALKNPLADPGIIGISGGSAFAAGIVTVIFPQMFFAKPIIACVGGILAYFLIYALSWKRNISGVRIILVGIAVSAVFSGFNEVLSSISTQGVTVSVSGLTQLTWNDVRLLCIYGAIGLAGAVCLAPSCNLMALSDETVASLGVNINLIRFLIALAAVVLASAVTAVVGVIGFLALITPHMARRLIGGDNRILVPFTMLLGAFALLLADTAGRLILAPNEISAGIIMNIAGGPFFIFLLYREGRADGNK